MADLATLLFAIATLLGVIIVGTIIVIGLWKPHLLKRIKLKFKDFEGEFEAGIQLTKSCVSRSLTPVASRMRKSWRCITTGNFLKQTPGHLNAANNAGVAAQAMKLPVTSVSYLKQAEDGGNTLATANLASRLITAGFAHEAVERLDNAKLKHGRDVHRNVAMNIGRAADAEAKRKHKSRPQRNAQVAFRGGRRDSRRRSSKIKRLLPARPLATT